MSEGDVAGHPDLGPVGAAMREEWRAEQEEATRDADAQRRHDRTLRDWLVDAMHRGDRIAVTVLEERFVGLPEEVGEDVVAVRTLFGRVDVHVCPGIPICVEVVERATRGGRRGGSGGSFRDALLARDDAGEMSVGTLSFPQGVDGRLAVGRDVVQVTGRGGAQTVVSLMHVAWVAPRRD